jgi:hypothetical protein
MVGARRFLSLGSTLAVTLVAVVAAAGASRPPSAQAADCSKTAAPGSLQSIVDGAQQGDVICMAPGVYHGPLTFQSKRGVTLRGSGPRVSILTGVNKDSLLVFSSSDLVFENFTLFYGHPSDAYVWKSKNVLFRNMDVGGGGIGIHYDVNSTGRISDSFVYAIEGDGVLIRRDSNVTVEHNWIFGNGGVGVSTVGHAATTTITQNVISHNAGPGVFAGQTPCQLLPPGHVEVPSCYLTDLAAFVGDANIILNGNVVQESGSTGIVMFPGTRGTFTNNKIWKNHLSGMFVWGANTTSQGDDYWANDEHAIEFRAYPDPLKYGQVGTQFPVRAVGRISHATIHDTVVLPESGRLGGGVLGQGANLDVSHSLIWGNRGIGVSYVNTSLGSINDNAIVNNRGSAICIYKAGTVRTSGNVVFGNVDDTVGVCHETTP